MAISLPVSTAAATGAADSGSSNLSPAYLLRTVSDVKSLKQVHARILKSPDDARAEECGSKLVSLYSLFGQMDYAELCFERIPVKTCFTWNMMIRGFTTHGFHQKALEFYSDMLDAHILPDRFTFPFVFKACSAIGAWGEAQEAHGRVIRTGLSSDVYISTSLVDFYAKLGGINPARRLFDGASLKNVVTWNAMIAGYAFNELDSEAVKVFRLMMEVGPEPNSSTLVAVLPAVARLGALDEGKFIHEWLGKRGGTEMNVSVSNSLITMYGKCGELENARKLFDEMPERSDVSWTAIISAYAQNGIVSEALKLLHEMQILGFKPASATVASILPVCAGLVDLKQGLEIHGYCIRNGFASDLVVATALVDMYAKCGCLGKAKQVFEEMLERNVICWNAMISAYGLHGYGKEALKLLLKMKETGIKPNGSTFVSIINACSHAGLVTEGIKCFNLMTEEFSIDPETKHFACVVDMLGRAGHLEEAYQFIKQMPVAPDAVIWGALLASCKVHNNLELGEKAAEEIFKLKADDPGYYVLLANMYADRGRWDEERKVREMMREKQLKKQPGCSWLEHGNTVHSFISGDFRHPEWETIYEKMEEVDSRLEEEGYVPSTNFALDAAEGEMKTERLAVHSERIALAFGLMKGKDGVPIRIAKNLRVCGDCHAVFKLVSRIYGSEIVLRDSNRFHRFENGVAPVPDGGNCGGNASGSEGFRLLEAVSCPGFRFRPTDEELLSHYLKKKVKGEEDKCLQMISEVDFCNIEPWDLPSMSIIQTKDQEWYFFSPRGKKYPKGSQTRRATRTGYWKATGKERPVKSGNKVLGTKRTLVFYRGRAPKGERSDWITHEFSLRGSKFDVPQDSFVLCRLCKKQCPSAQKGQDVNQIDMSPGSEGNGDEQSPTDTYEQETKSKNSSSEEMQLGANETSSSQDKEFPHEKQNPSFEGDNLFAEILEDNIVDIDDFPRYENLSELPQPRNEVDLWSPSEDPTPPQQLENIDTSLTPSQGTASRRIKLHHHRFWLQELKKQETRKGVLEEAIPWDVSLGQEGRRHRLSLMEGSSQSVLTILFCLALMILLVVLVLTFV
ncbi:hypothetical protein H6P81_003675 [Aristolochia fimbriata]|uniref:NAC domain-containing protein n=1 Tax=Aristolochia fimbriata TaxID=158543 RepID=A0AAV7FH60_ARIFI|nr:hypothetical protein H6P81_003675 [Aristolochia fimbriata]